MSMRKHTQKVGGGGGDGSKNRKERQGGVESLQRHWDDWGRETVVFFPDFSSRNKGAGCCSRGMEEAGGMTQDGKVQRSKGGVEQKERME